MVLLPAPGTTPPHLNKTDQIFPWFLSTHIPLGWRFVLASLFAAAMSTLASDLNCLSVVGVEDYYRKLKRNTTDAQRLRVDKVLAAVWRREHPQR
jgi:SSS family solute:Na+ symporter